MTEEQAVNKIIGTGNFPGLTIENVQVFQTSTLKHKGFSDDGGFLVVPNEPLWDVNYFFFVSLEGHVIILSRRTEFYDLVRCVLYFPVLLSFRKFNELFEVKKEEFLRYIEDVKRNLKQ